MITIEPMTRAGMHELYRGFRFDPAIFMDMALFEKARKTDYDPAKVDALYDKRAADPGSIFYAVILDGVVIGEVGLKHIDSINKQCELTIHLKDDSVKGRGYGTAAERLAIDLAFNELGIKTVLADCIAKNTRSQHILEKLGFWFLHEKDGFRYYKLEKS